ncbi:hypothetical protein V7S43_007532 [Phytophthora oleae]|uniref:Uncharacterized protein n=1 Tax=Phytophthora oleae TaxID=2107226 RepID=A0ABD3FLM8_9STRA
MRKTTAYEARKKRKRGLMEQVEMMQKELKELKYRLLVQQGDAGRATKGTEAENAALQELIQRQYLTHAAIQAALAGQAQRGFSNLQPVQSVICLGLDPMQRYNTLMSFREGQLDTAERYLAARSHGLDPGSSYCQEERFDSPEGDYGVVRFETTPICGAHVKEVFDAILGSVLNAEIFLSEMFGCISIREDNDFETSDFTQLRLVTSSSAKTIVESNTVLFSRFTDEDNDGEGYGVMAADFVDVDALFPYRTSERVRRDTTTLVTARSMASSDSQSPRVIVTRWTCLKIHRDSVGISRDPETEMAESSVCWGDTAHKIIQQQLAHATTPESPSFSTATSCQQSETAAMNFPGSYIGTEMS